MVVVLVMLTIATLLTVDYLARRRETERMLDPVGDGATVGRDPRMVPVPVMIQSRLLSVPGNTYMGTGHGWARPEPDRVVRVGAGRLPLHALGRADGVELPQVGARVIAGAPLATLRRGERKLTLRSPVEGVVESVNRAAMDRPEQINDQPFDDGWLCTVRPNSLALALRRLFVAEEATVWMRRELGRLRDVVGGLSQSGADPLPLQLDGGVPMEGFASQLDDTQWTQIQRFFDRSPAA